VRPANSVYILSRAIDGIRSICARWVTYQNLSLPSGVLTPVLSRISSNNGLASVAKKREQIAVQPVLVDWRFQTKLAGRIE
jgi:hypothetical protein